ncbi:MAG: hypothetical protein P8X58_08690 [Syntrophobacterales bacterium]
MKNLKFLGLLFCLVLVVAGTWTTNDFVYQPSLGARGAKEKSKFDTGLARVDSHLSKYKTLGDPGYATLSEALGTIGATDVTLVIPAGNFNLGSHTTIPSNVNLRVLKGGVFVLATTT